MLDEKLDFDLLRQQVPAFYYKRFKVLTVNDILTFAIPLDYGFGYLLRRISGKWAELKPAFWKFPELDFELIHSTRGRKISNTELPLRLFSTPAESGVVWSNAPSPVDQNAFGKEFTATPIKNRLIINEYYCYRETLFINLHFRTSINFDETYVDVMLDGYLIPETQLALWS